MRQELEEFVTSYSTPPNQAIPVATSPPSLRQEQVHINGSPVEMQTDEADESVTYLDDGWANSLSQSVSTQSSVSLDDSGMMALQELEHIDETASSVGEALPFPPSPDPDVQVIDLTESIVADFSRRESEEPSLNAAFHLAELSQERQRILNVTPPGFSTPPNSRIPLLDLPPPARRAPQQNESPPLANPQVLPVIVTPPLLRVGALRNRLSLRRQNAFARPRRVDTPRQARYIPVENPPQVPVIPLEQNRSPLRVLARPRRVDTPRQARSTLVDGHEVEDEVDEGIVDTTIDLTDSPPPPTPALDQSPATEHPAGVLAALHCPVCLDTLSAARAKGCRVLATTCGHIFCSNCLPRCVASNSQCPTCRARLLGHSSYHNLYIE